MKIGRMSVAVTWTAEAVRRLYCLSPGSCSAHTAEYALSDGSLVTVPLDDFPVAMPATAGRAVMTLPGPPGGGEIEHATVYAEDGTGLMDLTCRPPAAVRAGGAWQFPVSAPGLPA